MLAANPAQEVLDLINPGVSSLFSDEEEFDAINLVKPLKFSFLGERCIGYRR
jgi:hypothetical protein